MKNRSLRFEIAIYLIIFITVVFSLLLFLQFSMLDDFYRDSKIITLKEVNKHTISALKTGDYDYFKKSVKAEIFNNEVCVKVISDNKEVGKINNEVSCDFDFEDFYVDKLKEELQTQSNYLYTTDHNIYNSKIIIYGGSYDVNGENVIVLTAAKITPLNAMTKTLEKQFFIIVFVVIVATFLLATILSERFIRPIQLITEEIKNLDQGKYHSPSFVFTNKEFYNLNETLIKTNRKIIESENTKKEVIASISHDLKTPLTMIRGYAEIIRDIKEENTEENINVIIKETKRLSGLVNDILDLNQLRNKIMNIHPEKVLVNDLLSDVYRQFYTTFKRDKINSKLILLVEDVYINVDVIRIKQVLYNFINNAMIYNDKKDKVVIIKATNLDDEIEIGVYDNGIGINEDETDKIFDRYYRGKTIYKKYGAGMGIGLDLASEILNAHDLKYGVRTRVDKYSEFYFRVKKVKK